MAKKNSTKGPEVEGKDFCCVGGCKATYDRFGFCTLHYDYFKFGLIKKDGTKSPDYDRKFDHYQDYIERTGKGTFGIKKVA